VTADHARPQCQISYVGCRRPTCQASMTGPDCAADPAVLPRHRTLPSEPDPLRTAGPAESDNEFWEHRPSPDRRVFAHRVPQGTHSICWSLHVCRIPGAISPLRPWAVASIAFDVSGSPDYGQRTFSRSRKRPREENAKIAAVDIVEAVGPPSTTLVYTIPTEGAPSLRVFSMVGGDAACAISKARATRPNAYRLPVGTAPARS
jgi:hypothetical protein